MLMPKRVKRRKQFRGTMKGKALRGNKISYGEFKRSRCCSEWLVARSRKQGNL